jgi:hypothetical protein
VQNDLSCALFPTIVLLHYADVFSLQLLSEIAVASRRAQICQTGVRIKLRARESQWLSGGAGSIGSATVESLRPRRKEQRSGRNHIGPISRGGMT